MSNTKVSEETQKFTIANNEKPYKETTRPKKKKRRDKSDLGSDFIAPDGGWAWVVCLAAGISNLSLFPALQNYGLMYRQRMANLNFNAKETTTIVNIVLAVSSLVGLVNGAMFRRFTFRQVALTGGFMSFIGIFSSAFCTTFLQFLLWFSGVYGIGLGLCMAATSLAVNTYFKNKRRRATGFSWTITGLGPILFPHVVTFFLLYYGQQGTILIFSGVALNSVLCAMTLQPVLRHVKKPPIEKNPNDTNANGIAPETEKLDGNDEYQCKYCKYHEAGGKRRIFSSQYLFNEDDPDRPGYEITEPGPPMLSRANDGWFGSKISLASEKGLRHRLNSTTRGISVQEEQPHPTEDDHENMGLFKPNYFNREREDMDRYISRTSINSKSLGDNFHCTCAVERALIQKDLEIEKQKQREAEMADELIKKKMTFWQKVVRFFDLDLLKDFTFVNLAMGMSIMMFGEMNFSVLTPFILNSFGYTNEQISLAMSLLGAMDISVRFFAPIFLEKVKLENRVLFAFGIIAITIGRFIVTFTESYHVILIVFVLIGFGKGFRTIFSPLIIPSYVPLKRLPAASGLQLICNTLFSVTFGPILGLITDATNYKVTIHFINCFTCFALLMWLTESLIRRMLKKKSAPIEGH